MKKVTLFVIFAVLSLMKTEAQDYLISFTATGAVTFIDSVTVDNLTDRTSVTLGGGDTLHLTLGVGINLPELNHGVLRIYPNPLTKESTMIFTSPETGIGAIRIVDLSGKTIYQTSKLLSAGKHTFSISGISRGIYFVKVDGEGYNYSAKLISVGNYPGDVRIDYVSSGKINPGNPLKSTAATIDMPYTNGDLLLFNGISGIYSTILTDVPASSKSITFQFADCTDADNNNYSIVQIGAQTWMAENLNVGMRIDGSQEQTNNGIFEKYCYDNNENYCNIYGGLYQWHEMMQYVTAEGVQGICPTGWHLPADGEWAILTAYLQGEAVAGGKMKSTGSIEAGTGLWQTPNTGATNETGFTAIPGGYCDNGSFASIGGGGNWWSSSENSWNAVWSRYLTYFSNSMYRPSSGESFGYSVRCLKNASNVNTILNVPGSYQEWNPADSTTIITSLNADEKYEGYLWFPANTAYKYAKGSWALSWGDTGADGTLETDGNNILAGAAGYYKLNADLLSLTHSFLRTSWGVIGSSTPGGWDSETEMTFDTITEVWSVTMNLTAGEMLFRANHSWELSYGDNDANGTLEQGGANIAVTIPGNYTITMDLSKAVYNYQLTNNSLFTCGSSLTINHVTGNVAPVDKTVSYGTVNNIPGEPSKCWITSNLGADHQATARNDESEASAGWYWQFNRKQGYKHDGTTRTPNTVWIDLIDENLEWQALNDPCARELGNSWRIPTTTEWANVDAAGNWTNWNGPWNSDLKLHAAGFVGIPNGTLYSRGFAGDNWSSSRSNAQFGWALYFHSGTCEMTPNFKSNAFSLRCLRETGTSEIPAVTTGVITDITQTTATGGGEVTGDGGAEITARGVCWSISPYPTIIDSYTSDGTGMGVFVSNVSGLIPGTTYFIRAYATNNAGTAYGTDTSFSTINSVPQPCPGDTTVIYEGHTYNTVQIGTQCWLKENLNVGTGISGNQEQTNNGIIEKYCYGNDETNCETYGGLYQWNEMMQYVTTNRTRGICPAGWHLPEVAEGEILTAFLGDLLVAGGKMKEAGYAHWAPPNAGATNSSGLTALPGGVRGYNGTFGGLSTNSNFWSSQNDALTAWGLSLFSDSANASISNSWQKSSGFSVRCIRDVPVFYPLLNVPGSYQGWNPADSTTVIASGNADERYEGYLWFPANTEFKYAKGSWILNWGDNGANGTLERDGANILAGEEGYYKLNADLVALTHTFLRTTWGVIGSSTPGGWVYDTEMNYDTTTKVWSVAMDLVPGEIKFQANHSWDLMYGDNDANGTLEQDGANIAVPEAGNYRVTMNLSNPVYTYELKLNGPFICGSVVMVSHLAGNVAPVDKTVTYATATNIPGEPSKCWITSNLGADHQAAAVDDPAEPSAGWYWQFNRKQGYKHDGFTRTPNSSWIVTIDENLNWEAVNDPCALELGSPWHIPTASEWTNVDAAGNWTNWNGPWNSDLKLHAAGLLNNSNGWLYYQGMNGYYWSSFQDDSTDGFYLFFGSDNIYLLNSGKAYGFSIRCLRE